MSDNVERTAVENVHAALANSGTIEVSPLEREDAERGRFYFVTDGAMFSAQVEWIGDVPNKPTSEPTSSKVPFEVSPPVWRKLEAYAAEHGLPGPQEAARVVIRQALEEYVARG